MGAGSTPSMPVERCGAVERLLWRIFAPFEFAVTVGVGVVLYLFGALYFAACIFETAVGGLFKRASALFVQRFRTGRVFASANGKMEAPPSLSEIVARQGGPAQRRSTSWVN
jgi:hypothetical protein